jgi:hypothetical protein
MKSGKKIWYLIKFFAKKEHAEQFMEGHLYMNRLSYFKKIEFENGDGRVDAKEAISHWWQPDELIFKLNIPSIGEVEITNKDFAAPVSMAYDYHNHLHVFCMYAMWTDGFDCIDGKIDYAQYEADKLLGQLKVDERCFNFGEYAVIVPAVQFINRASEVIKGIRKKSWLKLVSYFDGSEFHGEFNMEEIPFNKLNDYSYQNEYRVCIDNQTRGDDPYILELDSIKEWSALVKSSELNKLFKIDSIEVPSIS